MHSGQVNSLHLSIGPQGLFLGSSGRLPCFFFLWQRLQDKERVLGRGVLQT